MSDKKKVLIIEDEEMLANMYQVKFNNDGYEALIALDGVDGIAIAKKEHPVLILLDIIMPKMDGFAVLKEIKSEPSLKDTPVVLLTNLGQDEDVSRGKDLGADGYLIKANNTPGEVIDKVKKFIK